ncbi:response regulator [Leptothoe sp. LEGE 181152]|nr:response regulator [Leptothoe sp. LEGE 181152]
MSNVFIIGELNHKIQRAKESLFTGVLAIGTHNEVEWFLYFLVGQIVWANTRTHSKRRWHRQCLKYSPDLSKKAIHDIAHQPENYKVMAQLVMQQKFSREQFSQVVIGCISEILFDIIYQATLELKTSQKLIYKVSSRNGANFPCIGLHREPIWQQVQQDWHAWQQANLTDYNPNLAPKIIRADILRERTSEATFRELEKLADGRLTLRDLAVKTGQPLILLTQSLIPHIRRDLMKLVNVKDLSSAPYIKPRTPTSFVPSSGSHHSVAKKRAAVTSSMKANPVKRQRPCTCSQANNDKGKAVVAYVDDNLADSQAMADIFKESDYRYVNISDSLQALTKLLELKPQLIFLDLVMPVVNGYELCAQIRRISVLKDVPVIIMTNNNSIPDRVRAKVVGSNGFLGKPIKPKRVLKVVLKHLQTEPVTSTSPAQFSRLSPSSV